MAAKIKSGDLVKVIRGKDRGKEGTVKQVLKDDRLIVEGVQIVKKHVRATQQGQQAGIVAVEAPIHNYLFINFYFMNLYIGNLNYNVREGDLRGVMEEYGTVASVKLITDRETRRSKGFAFVEMPNDGEAKEAIKQLNGAEYVNRTMVVKEALPKA